jgi:predicted  nucleic acid-binding Zn-ribbon protein
MEIVNGKMVVTEPQEFDVAKAQISELTSRYQQIEAGVKSLTQKQAALDKNSKSWISFQAETKALRTQNVKLSRQLTNQHNQQIMLALAALSVLLISIVWTEIRFAKLNPGFSISQQQTL